MARKCKCKICLKELNTDIAFQTTYNGKRMYCCNENEYSQWLLEKESYKQIVPTISEIIGYTSTNTIILKEIKTLHESYSYIQILNCFENHKNYIIKCLNQKNIQNEFSKIKYIFAIIKNNIADTQVIHNKNNENDIINIDDYGTGFNYKPVKNFNYLDLL